MVTCNKAMYAVRTQIMNLFNMGKEKKIIKLEMDTAYSRSAILQTLDVIASISGNVMHP